MADNRFEIAIVGAGYVGLTTGVCMAEMGHRVRIFDIDELKVASLSNGRVPFYEAGMDESLNRHLVEGNVSFSTEITESVWGAHFASCVCRRRLRSMDLSIFRRSATRPRQSGHI